MTTMTSKTRKTDAACRTILAVAGLIQYGLVLAAVVLVVAGFLAPLGF